MAGWKDFKKTGQLRVDEKMKQLGLLVIDDEKQIVSSLSETFSTHFKIYSSSDPFDALELFKKHQPKIIVSDQRMPDLTGIELFRKIKDILPTTKRILVTGYSDINVVVDALNEGLCWKYVTKPWEHEELKGIVLKAATEYLHETGEDKSMYGVMGF